MQEKLEAATQAAAAQAAAVAANLAAAHQGSPATTSPSKGVAAKDVGKQCQCVTLVAVVHLKLFILLESKCQAQKASICFSSAGHKLCS